MASSDDVGVLAPRRRIGQEMLEWLVIVLAALTVAVVVRTTAVQAFYIPSESMVPTLRVDDRVLVDKLSYRFGAIHRGDVVVFERPPSGAVAARDLVKRVVGLAGDTVEARDGRVFVNGTELAENYLAAQGSTLNLPLTTVPRGFIWVMGDNRTNSGDSRVFGPVATKLVLGKARLRVWPLARIGTL